MQLVEVHEQEIFAVYEYCNMNLSTRHFHSTKYLSDTAAGNITPDLTLTFVFS